MFLIISLKRKLSVKIELFKELLIHKVYLILNLLFMGLLAWLCNVNWVKYATVHYKDSIGKDGLQL